MVVTLREGSILSEHACSCRRPVWLKTFVKPRALTWTSPCTAQGTAPVSQIRGRFCVALATVAASGAFASIVSVGRPVWTVHYTASGVPATSTRRRWRRRRSRRRERKNAGRYCFPHTKRDDKKVQTSHSLVIPSNSPALVLARELTYDKACGIVSGVVSGVYAGCVSDMGCPLKLSEPGKPEPLGRLSART